VALVVHLDPFTFGWLLGPSKLLEWADVAADGAAGQLQRSEDRPLVGPRELGRRAHRRAHGTAAVDARHQFLLSRIAISWS